MSYASVLYTAPTEEPLTLSEAKGQVHVADAIIAHDPDISSLITAARVYVEQYTSRQLITATWDLKLDCFPASCEPIYIPKSPLVSVTSITYLDSAGDSQTWSSSNYRVSTASEPGRIVPAFGQTYPTTQNTTDAVTIRYVSGYGSATDVPLPLKQAMKLLIAHWFENRSAVLTGSISKEIEFSTLALLDMYRVGDEFICYSGREVYA